MGYLYGLTLGDYLGSNLLVSVCVFVLFVTCRCTYMHTYLHTYIHTYLHTYIHTCIVHSQEASEYASSNGIIYMETSAKAGQNVKELFENIATKLPKNQASDEDSARFPILPAQEEKKSPCC
jgi:hypothetical protein